MTKKLAGKTKPKYSKELLRRCHVKTLSLINLCDTNQYHISYVLPRWHCPLYSLFTARIRRMGEGIVFTGVCVCSHFGRGGYPDWLTGGYPLTSWCWGWVPHPSWWGYPSSQETGCGAPCQDWVGYPLPLSGLDEGTPCPSGDRAAESVLATRRALCLLRSRRRTFLFQFLSFRVFSTSASPGIWVFFVVHGKNYEQW